MSNSRIVRPQEKPESIQGLTFDAGYYCMATLAMGMTHVIGAFSAAPAADLRERIKKVEDPELRQVLGRALQSRELCRDNPFLRDFIRKTPAAKVGKRA